MAENRLFFLKELRNEIFFLRVIFTVDHESDLRNVIIFSRYEKNHPKRQNGISPIQTPDRAEKLQVGRFRPPDSKSLIKNGIFSFFCHFDFLKMTIWPKGFKNRCGQVEMAKIREKWKSRKRFETNPGVFKIIEMTKYTETWHFYDHFYRLFRIRRPKSTCLQIFSLIQSQDQGNAVLAFWVIFVISAKNNQISEARFVIYDKNYP